MIQENLQDGDEEFCLFSVPVFPSRKFATNFLPAMSSFPTCLYIFLTISDVPFFLDQWSQKRRRRFFR